MTENGPEERKPEIDESLHDEEIETIEDERSEDPGKIGMRPMDSDNPIDRPEGHDI
jgi:hypothetical protein